MLHQDYPGPEVYLTMAAEFGVDEHQLQRVWQGYCAQRAFDNSPRTALDRIKMMPAAFPPEALEYFAALGLEMFSRGLLDSKGAFHG